MSNPFKNLKWSDIEAHNARVFANRFKNRPDSEPAQPPASENVKSASETHGSNRPVVNQSEVTVESDLADDIFKFCESQWPRWKILRARRDKPSTIPVGCQDDTVFASGGRVFCFELKKKGGKPDADQLAWHKELEMLGHKVFVIRSMGEFIEIVNSPSEFICQKCGLRNELGEKEPLNF